jgi:glyoxylate/hydroxypyruvate reductase A
MYVVLNPIGFDPAEWRELFEKHAPSAKLEIIPNVTAPVDVDVLMTMSPPDWPASRFPNLRCAIQLGHGIDGLLRSRAVPDHVPIVRLVDETITVQVTSHALAAVLRYHCKIEQYDELKRQHVWRRLGTRHPSETRVGVLGLGNVGRYIVGKLRALGFAVGGWSRSPKAIDGVETFVGKNELTVLLSMSDVVLCVLPLVEETRHLLSRETFAAMKPGCFVINLGRGGLLHQEDLLSALSGGSVSGAYLDVFEPEPLPPEHPFWDHPKITMTPHASSETRPSSCISQIVDNVNRLENGEALINVVDRSLGY